MDNGKGGRIKDGKWGWLGWQRMEWEKQRQLHFKNNKNK